MTRKLSNVIGLGWKSATVGLHSVGNISVTASGTGIVLPPIVIGAIVNRENTVEEGSLIDVLEPAWKEIGRIARESPDELFQFTPEQWEEIVAASYKKAGYDEVILTPRSGDFGRDVIAVKRGWGSIRIIDQVKAYKPGHLVTANDVRSLSGVLNGDRSASKGIITTTSDFAPLIVKDPFIAPFLPFRLELINGALLFKRLADLASET